MLFTDCTTQWIALSSCKLPQEQLSCLKRQGILKHQTISSARCEETRTQRPLRRKRVHEALRLCDSSSFLVGAIVRADMHLDSCKKMPNWCAHLRTQSASRESCSLVRRVWLFSSTLHLFRLRCAISETHGHTTTGSAIQLKFMLTLQYIEMQYDAVQLTDLWQTRVVAACQKLVRLQEL